MYLHFRTISLFFFHNHILIKNLRRVIKIICQASFQGDSAVRLIGIYMQLIYVTEEMSGKIQ